MKSLAFRTWRHLRGMPGSLLGFTLTLWICGTLVIFFPLLPGWKDDAWKPSGELRSGGISLEVIASGVVSVLLGSLIYLGYSWVRHILMLVIVAVGFSPFFTPGYRSVPTAWLVIIAVIAVLVGVRYLYFKHDVVGYFTRELAEAEQAAALNGP